MGFTFSNYNIRKTEVMKPEEILNAVNRLMESRGYSAAEEADADGEVVVYNPSDGGWVSVWSELLSVENNCDMSSTAAWLSKELKTDILTAMCCDSDFMSLNLINTQDGTDAWANIQEPYGGIERETNFQAWRGRVKSLEKFEAEVNEDRVFAEDFMYTLDEQLGLPGEQGCFYKDSAEELAEKGSVTRLYFALPKGDIVKQPPMLEVLSFSLCPCKLDVSTKQLAFNKGRASKGIAIAFTGDYVKNEEITFSDVSLEYRINGEWVIIPITLKKCRMVGGEYMYYWEDREFSIPPAANPNLPLEKRIDEEFNRSFGVRFTPHGNPRKLLDIKIHLLPLENPKGQCVWYVYRFRNTKSEYIEWFNETSGSMRGMLNPDDYDLD